MDTKLLKKGRNFYVPDFINDLLEQEAEKHGGKGTVTAAAILAFSELSDKSKRAAVKKLKQKELDVAFAGK